MNIPDGFVFIIAGLMLMCINLLRASRSGQQRKYHLVAAAGFAAFALGGFTGGVAKIATMGVSVIILSAALVVQKRETTKTTSS
ncbi:hypothetical protein SVXHr_2877 [Halorhabdus sp. SVX81]|uniref:hypothetical protein n=1 Tax=Halorhabdus sp. SVX81 TaxID=2978283 RepID=UPI0023DA8873|nr:hypothetical protein [Halorhabdus sp. SVX81]WEL19013.1 hypothetical protein SVXHr_2877 [Halorhabdus sp. SVX81]